MTIYPALSLYIDGEWIADRPRGEDVINPATEEVLGRLPHATREDLDRALSAAARAFDSWGSAAPTTRQRIILEAVRLIRERAVEIAPALTLEHGKPLAESQTELLRAADLIEWNANECLRAYGSIIPAASEYRQSVLRFPIGPVAAFSPWNFPASSPARKIGAALAAGCPIIIKPSEETPAAACALVRCFADAGLPRGVLNLVFGVPAEISAYLIASPVIRMVTFTGSTPVGKHLAQLAAAQMKPAIMELGGHAPVIVCEDADPVEAAKVAASGKFRNAGQVCVAPTRFLVHERIAQPFTDSLVEAARAVKVGNGLDPKSQMGPLINKRRLDAIESLVQDAIASGAEILTGGHKTYNQGFFYEPTVLSNVSSQMRIMNIEPFGPLAPVSTFSRLDDAIAVANGLPYGLAAYAFTDSAPAIAALSDRIETGLLAINHVGGGLPETPFGGVKESGMGREGGAEGLDEYYVTKLVTQRIVHAAV